MTAIGAMLGDRWAYAETPHFTVRRLQLRFGAASDNYRRALKRTIFPSTATADWGGYRNFNPGKIDAWAELHRLESVAPPSLRLYLQRLAGLAGSSSAAAAFLAKLLMDWKFNTTRIRQSMLHSLIRNGETLEEQPEDALVMWATVYPWIASKNYGPNTLIYDVDQQNRSADLPYLQRLLARGYTLGKVGQTKNMKGQDAGIPLVDLGRMESGGLTHNWPETGVAQWPNSDLGQLVVPAYVLPGSLAGFELRDETDRTEFGAAPIEIGFYKLVATGISLVLVVDGAGASGGRPDCIVPGDTVLGDVSRLYACKTFDWNSFRIPALPKADVSRPVPVAVVLVAIDAAAAHSTQIAACEAARHTVTQPKVKRPDPLRWPRMIAALRAIRVNCHSHVLAISSETRCEDVLHELRSRTSTGSQSEVDGLLPEWLSGRLGWDSHEWRGDVPDEWYQNTSPTPSCPTLDR